MVFEGSEHLSEGKPHPAANAMKEAMSEMSSMSEFANPYYYGGMFLYGAPWGSVVP